MEQDRPIEIPVAGPGVPRYHPSAWILSAAIPVLVILAILLGALWQ